MFGTRYQQFSWCWKRSLVLTLFKTTMLKHLLMNNEISMWFWIYCKNSPHGIYRDNDCNLCWQSAGKCQGKSGRFFFLPTSWQPWVKISIVRGAIDFQGQIRFEKQNFLASLQLEIHNHHITICREPWVPRLLHRPHCFMVSILCTHLYTWPV